MKPFAQQDLDASIEKFARRDPELTEEIKRKLGPAPEREAVQRDRVEKHRETLGIAKETPLIDEARRKPTAAGKRLLDTIVRAEARPVLLVRDNRVTPEFLGPESEVWRARLTAAHKLLERVLPAVGRVELSNHPDYTWVGTGWLVDADVIVTNRHVAREFARRGPQGCVFRPGLGGGPMACTLDFYEEYERGSELTFEVERVLWIAKYEDADVAFLRLRRDPLRAFPAPVPLATGAQQDDVVATIGYPARDSRVPDQALVRRIFGDVYEKKRLAPGVLLEVDGDEVLHDCSTLGGNSGSLVVDLKSGEAVGLHFAGQFMLQNYAVAASKIAALVNELRAGLLTPAIDVTRSPDATPVVAPPAPAAGPADVTLATTDGASMTFRLHVPLDVTVRLGTPAAGPAPAPHPVVAPGAAGPTATDGDPTAPEHLAKALAAARDALRGNRDVLDVSLGYRFKHGWITDEQVIVVEVKHKRLIPELVKAGATIIPNHFLGVGVDVRTGGILEQLAELGLDMTVFDLEGLEGRVKPGLYREPPELELEPIDERMKAIFHVSPDAGFPTLGAFIARVKRSMTATMYEWDAAHVSEALVSALTGTRTLTMVTQRRGTDAAVEEMADELGGRFEHVWASVGKGGLIPSAYHIKVASRDGEEAWLSSGNWKESNQPNIDPVGTGTTTIGDLRKYNRDWHAVIANPKLATLFQQYIEWDLEEARRVPVEEAPELVFPDVFVPEPLEPVEERPEVKYFAPLELDEPIAIQPLLTPDRDARDRRIFMHVATELVGSAKQHLYIQNQSFALLDDGNNEDAFEAFFTAVKERQDAGVDVRIIFRDPREFSYNTGSETLAKTLTRLKRFGIDTDRIKVQKRLHTKAIMVDSAQVLFGSHNLTNSGALYNRDASLLVSHPEVTAYFESIFLYDWAVLAVQNAEESVGGMSLAKPGEPTPPGFRRMTLEELGFSL